ncbi:MAG: histidine phosphatase family protein [Oscillatoria sp. Prado101]|jgi:broad specificity phosphatase PhoE|nr:histidine phosphatase family protein [Oscillatoria sp. Prado101]
MPQTVWIARHANRLDFVNPDWFITADRPYDPPLSPDGEEQARALAKRMAGESIAHIFASPFLRTVQTAHAVAEVLDLLVKVESGLSEWLNPEWMPAMPEKLSLEALAERFPKIDTSYTSRVLAEYPETGDGALERAALTAKRLAGEFPKDILLVGHGASVLGATMGLAGRAGEPELKVALCSLFKLVRRDGEWVIELNGDTSHLSQTEEVIRFN